MFINAQLPFNRSAASGLLVRSQRSSQQPDSTIGSLEGLNSSSKLQMVDVTTVNNSLDGVPCNNVINGFQTEWSCTSNRIKRSNFLLTYQADRDYLPEK